jgi:site-specific recombinase XerD
MNPPVYSLITHKGEPRILVLFALRADWNARMKKVPGARWSQTLKAWHIPDTPENRKKCGLDEKQPDATDAPPPPWHDEEPAESQLPQHVHANIVPAHLSENNQQQLRLFLERLALKKYSLSTQRTYRNELMQLLALLGDHCVQDLGPEQLKRYMLYCTQQLKLSENTLHSRLNALKFYFEQVLGREKFFYEIPRPKKQIILPKILGETEVGRLFKALTNNKHRAILFTAYSAGLRVSETVNLKLKHIDSDRMQILVEKSKGKKDRYVMLSPVLLDILRNYLLWVKPAPVTYLFENPSYPGAAYSSRSAQKIFQVARQMAGIQKDVSFHSLRHSFATHLLEKGIDIRYIKELLGHFDIRTTERYLHVRRDQLVNIVSPLDDLWDAGKL